MNKYLVIGNPIKHSLSPILHNYWFKTHNEKAIYEKKMVEENQTNYSEILNKASESINSFITKAV